MYLTSKLIKCMFLMLPPMLCVHALLVIVRQETKVKLLLFTIFDKCYVH